MSNQALYAIGVVIATAAWVAFAEHPTAKNLRRAIIDTLELG